MPTPKNPTDTNTLTAYELSYKDTPDFTQNQTFSDIFE